MEEGDVCSNITNVILLNILYFDLENRFFLKSKGIKVSYTVRRPGELSIMKLSEDEQNACDYNKVIYYCQASMFG
jgi:hypothetical protein